MSWATFYLTCFFTGLLLTVVSFVFGGGLHFHVNLPGHLFDFTVGHHAGPHGGHSHSHASPFNVASMMMFLTWFGGAGFVLATRPNITGLVALPVATGAGFAGGALMYHFLTRVFLANERPLRLEDFEMVGILGHISSPIRESGTGELIYLQQGTRRSCGARSEDGTPIDRGTEVVVMRYDKGIAYVRRFDELTQA
jgi:membrane protein implicated in regulation of membrane protease activity